MPSAMASRRRCDRSRSPMWSRGALIAHEDPSYGAEREVEAVLDDPVVPPVLRIEHIPAYSSGGKLLVITGARALMRDGYKLVGQLVTVGDWRAADSDRVRRIIGYRYYGSGWAARTDVGKFVLPLALAETIEAYSRPQR